MLRPLATPFHTPSPTVTTRTLHSTILRYEWLAYFDSKRQKDEYLNQKRTLFKQACDRQPGARGHSSSCGSMHGSSTATRQDDVDTMDFASSGDSRNGSFDALEAMAHETTCDQAARPNDGSNNAADDRVCNDANSGIGGQPQAISANQVAPVVFNAMCNAVRPTLHNPPAQPAPLPT